MSSNNKAMEEALQVAVSRMNRSENGGAPAPTDPIGLLAAVLPKLIESRGERDAIIAKIDGLESENLSPLREELRLARKQIHRLHRAQEEMMAILQQLSEQQNAIGEAVLDLAKQMARIEFVEPMPEPDPRSDFGRHAGADSKLYNDVRSKVQNATAPRRTQSSKAQRGSKKPQA
jgi:hypothetical protein